ncbi:hypothetical protein [Streptomyces sp. CBMA152]|uniref:hypothetical protein n=1 Tax=Streptomyces sp. CBMA152 TaxID=1896312 RepID=UPI001660749C|nr:hypothetical protein [Streptomyces sp. CBMA152]MBD0743574.1 hypothetical protein [Streptomyces sp. CBMA152]
MSELAPDDDALMALVEQVYRVNRADVATGRERIRDDLDAIAAQLTETLLPADMRAAGLRFEWAEER